MAIPMTKGGDPEDVDVSSHRTVAHGEGSERTREIRKKCSVCGGFPPFSDFRMLKGRGWTAGCRLCLAEYDRNRREKLAADRARHQAAGLGSPKAVPRPTWPAGRYGEYVCLECGESFGRRHPAQRFCCPQHAARYRS